MDGPGSTTLAAQVLAMDKMIGAGGPFADYSLALFTNEAVPGSGMVLADFEEATFTGYARATNQDFPGSYIAADQQVHATGPGALFEMTDATIPETVFGWYILNTAGTAVLAAYRFPEPVPLDAVNKGIAVLPDIMYGK